MCCGAMKSISVSNDSVLSCKSYPWSVLADSLVHLVENIYKILLFNSHVNMQHCMLYIYIGIYLVTYKQIHPSMEKQNQKHS